MGHLWRAAAQLDTVWILLIRVIIIPDGKPLQERVCELTGPLVEMVEVASLIALTAGHVQFMGFEIPLCLGVLLPFTACFMGVCTAAGVNFHAFLMRCYKTHCMVIGVLIILPGNQTAVESLGKRPSSLIQDFKRGVDSNHNRNSSL
jgi:hypothetical protein